MGAVDDIRRQTCKHFNGMAEDKCRLGIKYASLDPDPESDGMYYRLPCNTRQHETTTFVKGVCDKFCLPTEDELEEEDRVLEAMMERFTRTLPLISQIKEEHHGTNWAGVVVCPICSGNLHLSHAACNGHVHGKCETDDCVSFME